MTFDPHAVDGEDGPGADVSAAALRLVVNLADLEPRDRASFEAAFMDTKRELMNAAGGRLSVVGVWDALHQLVRAVRVERGA